MTPLPPPPLCKDDPQTSEQLHTRLIAAYGPDNVPALTTIQSTLSVKGTQLGEKIKDSRKRVSYKRFSAGTSSSAEHPAHAVSAEADQGHARQSPPSRARLKAKRERGAAVRVEAEMETETKVEELLRQPLSAFTLFGLSQRGVLKKQKGSGSMKEVVKAIGEWSSAHNLTHRVHTFAASRPLAGQYPCRHRRHTSLLCRLSSGERWLLLTDAERKKYESMAEEDAQRAVTATGRSGSEGAAPAEIDPPSADVPESAETGTVEMVEGGEDDA